MRRPYIPFFIFAMLFTLTIPFSFDVATSVVPGWHSTVLTPFFLITISVAVILLIVTIAYWTLAKKVGSTNLTTFIFHFSLTIPTVLFVRAPGLFLTLDGDDFNVLNRQVTFTTALILTSFILFVVGQTLFAGYCLKTWRQKSRTT